MIRKHRAAGIAAGIAIAVFWGVSFLSTKIVVAVMPPMTLGLARFVGATAILAVLKLILAPRDRIGAKDVPVLAAAGLVGVTAYFLMENNGIKLMTASEASVTIAFIPVLSLVAERLFLKTKLSALQYVGAILSTLGVYVLVSSGLSLESGVLGYVFMLGAGLSWVVYSFLTRGLFASHQRITVVFWQSLFGTLGFIPFALSESSSWAPASAPVWLNIAFLAVACSALGYWLYAACVDILGLTASSVFINLIPVVSLSAGFALLGERLGGMQWLGSAIVLAGVFLATLSAPRAGRAGKAKAGSD